MPYTAESKRLAKEPVSNLRANTFCCHCGNQPIEYHNEEHEQDNNRRVAHLVALGFPKESYFQDKYLEWYDNHKEVT